MESNTRNPDTEYAAAAASNMLPQFCDKCAKHLSHGTACDCSNRPSMQNWMVKEYHLKEAIKSGLVTGPIKYRWDNPSAVDRQESGLWLLTHAKDKNSDGSECETLSIFFTVEEVEEIFERDQYFLDDKVDNNPRDPRYWGNTMDYYLGDYEAALGESEELEEWMQRHGLASSDEESSGGDSAAARVHTGSCQYSIGERVEIAMDNTIYSGEVDEIQYRGTCIKIKVKFHHDGEIRKYTEEKFELLMRETQQLKSKFGNFTPLSKPIFLECADDAVFAVTDDDLKLDMPPVLRYLVDGNSSFSGEVNLSWPKNFNCTQDDMNNMFSYLRSGVEYIPRAELAKLFDIFGGCKSLSKKMAQEQAYEEDLRLKKKLNAPPLSPEQDYTEAYTWRAFTAGMPVPEAYSLTQNIPQCSDKFWARKPRD